MAVRLRLARHGATHRPFYWLVAADSKFARDGRYLEKLGTYNPMLPTENSERLKFNQDRIQYWLSVGAQPSERVTKLLSVLKIEGIDKFANKKKSTIGKPKTTKNPDKRRSTKDKQDQEASVEQSTQGENNTTAEQQQNQDINKDDKSQTQKLDNPSTQQDVNENNNQQQDHQNKKEDSASEEQLKNTDNVADQQASEKK